MANKTLKNKSYKKQMGAGKKKRGTKKKPLSDWNRFTQIMYKKNKNKPGYKLPFQHSIMTIYCPNGKIMNPIFSTK